MKYTTVLFDFDGTLNETGPAIFAATRAVMKAMGVPDIPDSEMVKLVGPPLRVGFSTLLHMPPQDIEPAVNLYREFAKSAGMDLVKPYPGILELLKRLKEAGCTVGLVTAKVQSTAEMQVERYGFAPYLDLVHGAHEDGSGNKDELLWEVLSKYPIDKSSAVMVGDRCYDLQGAHTVGLPCIGVLYGYGPREELVACKPEYLAATVAELEAILFS